MLFNLIHEKWIPVRRKNGDREVISPWQITSEIGDNPFVAPDYPRADFNGAIMQFLIGLVQACIPPMGFPEWRERYIKPPDSNFLKNKFEEKAYAFYLDGDGPRFMQDLELTPEDMKEKVPVSSLIIEAPGDNALKKNTDFFVKSGLVQCLCPACASAALFTLQINAPLGGRGQRVSIRGGGPLTTLVIGKNVWQTIWNNTLFSTQLNSLGCDSGQPEEGGVFPWLAKTRTSSNNETTTPQHVHPFHCFWAMPRRIKLILENKDDTVCSICGEKSNSFVKEYICKPHGYKYEGFAHPLTPYIWRENEAPLSKKGVPQGLGYRNWLGIVVSASDDKSKQSPAQVIQAFRNQRFNLVKRIEKRKGEDEPDFRIWAFGFDMDNMKARAWNEGVMPVMGVGPEIMKDYSFWISALINCADYVRKNMRDSIKQGLFHKSNSTRGKTIFDNSDSRFWKETESVFYSAIRELHNLLENNMDTLPVRENWLKEISSRSKTIFTVLTQNGLFSSADPKRIALAWDKLRKLNSKGNKTIRKILDLPKPHRDPASKGGRK